MASAQRLIALSLTMVLALLTKSTLGQQRPAMIEGRFPELRRIRQSPSQSPSIRRAPELKLAGWQNILKRRSSAKCTSCDTRCTQCKKHHFLCWLHRKPCCNQPFGSSLSAHFSTQISNGTRARLVLHHYDFVNDPQKDLTALNVAGHQRLAQLSKLMQSSGFPLIVEVVPGHPDISEARRLFVMDVLSTDTGMALDDDRVVVGRPLVPGISGTEAIEHDKGQLQVTRSQGLSSAVGVSSQSRSSTSQNESRNQ